MVLKVGNTSDDAEPREKLSIHSKRRRDYIHGSSFPQSTANMHKDLKRR